MESESSLNHSMNSALKHYSSMFFLPSYKKSLLAIAVICVGLVGVSTFGLIQLSLEGLTISLVLGLSLFALTLSIDTLMSRVILGVDPIYVLRRTLALSFFGWVLWGFFILLGVLFGGLFGLLLWVKFCLLGYAAVLTLRSVVFIATSSAAIWRRLLSVLLQPMFCIIAFVVFWTTTISSAIPVQVLPFLVISPIVGFVAVYLFLSFINHLGHKIYAMPSLPLFRAFMLNWVVGLNAPLEGFLERMGEDADVEVTLLKFDASKPKAAIIVPNVHPGPFKNIGSSLLPSLLKESFERALGCDACVPLGILGHELDLASQLQNHKIISHVVAAAKFEALDDVATPFVEVTEGPATVSCQIFGKTAFLSFTLAPKTTEDLPQELGRIVREEAEQYGLTCTITVNSHNSINSVIDTEAFLEELRAAASKCLKKAIALPTTQFMVGAATVFPKEFSLKDGMGTGGITAIVVQLEKQRTVYVVIDGNNIISGLRERTLQWLKSVGFDECEVFTTDTHAVSAMVTGRRGYHPVGEVMNNDLLLDYINEVARKAVANLEPSKAGCLRFVVPKVRVIGEARLHSLTTLVDKAIQKAKQTVVPIFALEGVILIWLLTFF
jgi:putative membrane protein